MSGSQNARHKNTSSSCCATGWTTGYLGNWEYRTGNANVETDLLARNLRERGYPDNLIAEAIRKLRSDASLGGGRSLYEANRDVYDLLRYGVKVKPGVGEKTETVWLIDWDNPGRPTTSRWPRRSRYAGQHTKRPDIVLYVNGIALVTLELKRSKSRSSEGIRQTIGNQKPEFIRPFFTTVQLVMAGNDVEGLSYGVIDTPEKYWLKWRLISRTSIRPHGPNRCGTRRRRGPARPGPRAARC